MPTWNIAATVVLSVLSVLLGASLTYVPTRGREHEADWRKLKFDCYREYMPAVSGIIEGRSTPTSQKRYSDSMNSMVLVAPPSVLRNLYAFQDSIGYKDEKRDMAQYEKLQNDVIARSVTMSIREVLATQKSNLSCSSAYRLPLPWISAQSFEAGFRRQRDERPLYLSIFDAFCAHLVRNIDRKAPTECSLSAETVRDLFAQCDLLKACKRIILCNIRHRHSHLAAEKDAPEAPCAEIIASYAP